MENKKIVNYSDVSVNNKKKRDVLWIELLKQWVFLVEKSYRVMDGQDAVYAYKERTNVGLFAAAAVANGWFALEECGMKKSKMPKSNSLDKSPKDPSIEYQGRSDLRMWRDDTEYAIEAKFIRVALKTGSPNKLNKSIDKVLKDLDQVSPIDDKKSRRIALIYVVPTLTNNHDEKFSEEDRKVLIDELVTSIGKRKPDFMAHAFSGAVSTKGSKTSRVAHGVILFGKEVV